jgi:hypothetical protein
LVNLDIGRTKQGAERRGGGGKDAGKEKREEG